MIDLSVYANQIQTEINALFNASALSDIQIVVFTDVGRYKAKKRRGNKVTTYINALLTSTPGANETANDGTGIYTDNLVLEFAVPLVGPRFNATEMHPTEEDDVFVFVEQVKSLVDKYFSTNVYDKYTDEDGKVYSVGFDFSMSATGAVGNDPRIGYYVTFTVYIVLSLVQNGINSRSVTLMIDGESVPFQSMSVKRTGVSNANVYSNSDNNVSKMLYTSSIFAIEVGFPAVTKGVATQFADYLTGGKSNTAHFVKLDWSGQEYYYLMTYGDISSSVEGTANVGLTMPLVELESESLLAAYPAKYTVARINVAETTKTVSLTVNTDCVVMSNGISERSAGAFSITVDPDKLEYDEETEYFLTVVACPLDNTAVTFSNVIGGSMTVIQEGVING